MLALAREQDALYLRMERGSGFSQMTWNICTWGAVQVDINTELVMRATASMKLKSFERVAPDPLLLVLILTLCL